MEALIDLKQDFFANIPTQIMIEILLRLPVPTIMRCKRVCKSWLSLVESFEFAESHVSKSVRGLALNEDRPLTLALFRGDTFPKPYEILEVVDSQDTGHRCNVVFEFSLPRRKLILHGSANGLLLMLNTYLPWPHNHFICNPLTREYIKLPPPLSLCPCSSVHDKENTYGFGVSKLTRKYKVVRMSHEFRQYSNALSPPKSCEVYTLGTGSWRSVAAHDRPLRYDSSPGVSLNGNVHWLVKGLEHGHSFHKISYFDLETECFNTFSVPHYGYGPLRRSLCALGDSLCFCAYDDYVFDIWLMNKYGDDQSWRKVCSIEGSPVKLLGATVVPIKMFKNGDIMFANQPPVLYFYSRETNTMLEVDRHTAPFANFGIKPRIYVYAPSFLPLKTFAMEDTMDVLIDLKQDFFANIPPDIVRDILSRLPIPTIIRCKYVCKSWQDLVQSLEFAKSHFSKSVRCLARLLTLVLFRGKRSSEPYEVLESVDTQNSGHQWKVIFKFSFPHWNVDIHSSVDGLLLLLDEWRHKLFICNPVTCEYIKLPPIPIVAVSPSHYGFGVSKLTRKYKVVMICHTCRQDLGELSPPECEVYTLGTGSWRSVPAGGPLTFNVSTLCVFLNGNLHWLGCLQNRERISCFDLETECFSSFSVPQPPGYHGLVIRRLCVLGQSLCLCDHLRDYVIDIWSMNKYGDDQSWRKVCSIRGSLANLLGAGVVPIKIFKNGNVLLANEVNPKLYCYSNITRTVRVVDHTKSIKDLSSKPSIYNPSFLPLKMFAMEHATSF